jgi:hypothetical protein
VKINNFGNDLVDDVAKGNGVEFIGINTFSSLGIRVIKVTFNAGRTLETL